ncbi:hypothetical protein [Photobacterium leiognathi]|uniref:hypothetical protein n=1 Tax=Photobacterium leiognathi TaxID=553611 RepID=UPI002980AC76|nr:hypothetical protein [Photobacterium leiognathi]
MTLQLHQQQLQHLWNKKTYTNKNKHRSPLPDGILAFESLFSVQAFSTKKENTKEKTFALIVTKRLEDELFTYRDALRDRHKKYKLNWGDIALTPYNPKVIVCDFDEKKLNSAPAALIKIFQATDNLLVDINRARRSGEFSHEVYQEYYHHEITHLRALIQRVTKICLSFHQKRKKIVAELSHEKERTS